MLSGKELPTFKFELEKSKGRVLANSFGKEATVEQLPISKRIAGVSMQLELLQAGDVGYIPQGYGHSIENVGSDPSRILIGFNSGIYESIDLSSWIAGNPVDVLATNFNKPESLIRTFPRKDVFIAPRE